MAEIILDIPQEYEDGPRKRRKRRKHLTAMDKFLIVRKLRQVGFTHHEIGMWIEEDVHLNSRVAQNLIYARRLLMKYWMDRGDSFTEARQKCVQDRIDTAKAENPKFSEKESEDYIWSVLYAIGDPRDRRTTGSKPPWMKKASVKIS